MGFRLWIITVFLVVVWGCGQTQPAVTPVPSSVVPLIEGHTVITFWHGETHDYEQVIQQLVIEYQRSHPGIEIQVEAHGPNLLQDYRRAVLAGGSPDLVLLNENRWIGPLAEQGLIADLSEDLEPNDYNALALSALDGARYTGKLYGLPVTLNVPVLFYRANVFTTGEPPNTTDDWFRVARSLNTSSQVGLAYNVSLYFTQPYLSAWGGEIFDDQENVVLATSSLTATSQWLEWIHDLTVDSELLVRDDHRVVNRAVQNNAVMTVDWAQNLPLYRQLWGDDAAVRPLPILSETGKNPVPWVRSTVLAINPRSQVQTNVVLDIMRFFVAPKTQSVLRNAGFPIVRRDLPDAADPVQIYIDQAADLGQAWPTSIRYNEHWITIASMVRKVINGQPVDDTIFLTERLLRN